MSILTVALTAAAASTLADTAPTTNQWFLIVNALLNTFQTCVLAFIAARYHIERKV